MALKFHLVLVAILGALVVITTTSASSREEALEWRRLRALEQLAEQDANPLSLAQGVQDGQLTPAGRRLRATALLRTRSSDVIAMLGEVASDPTQDLSVRRAVVETIGSSLLPGAVPILEQLLEVETNDRLRGIVVDALSAFPATPRTTAALLDVATGSVDVSGIRMLAIESLARTAPKALVASGPTLLRADSVEVRAKAAIHLASLQSGSELTIQSLAQVIGEPELPDWLAHRAVEALESATRVAFYPIEGAVPAASEQQALALARLRIHHWWSTYAVNAESPEISE